MFLYVSTFIADLLLSDLLQILDPNLASSSKQAMFLNILFRAIKADENVKRAKAFAKRLLQVCSVMPAQFVAGVLYLLSEVFKAKPGLYALVTQPEDHDDDEEHFGDAPDSDAEDLDATIAREVTPDDSESEENFKDAPDSDDPALSADTTAPSSSVSTAAPSDVLPRSGIPAAPANDGGVRDATSYDMRKRVPEHAGADRTCLWELVGMADHYHPTVEAWAKHVIAGTSVVYTGDPLRDFTQSKFLDRFVFKKPKAHKSDRGGSVMQPRSNQTAAVSICLFRCIPSVSLLALT